MEVVEGSLVVGVGVELVGVEVVMEPVQKQSMLTDMLLHSNAGIQVAARPNSNDMPSAWIAALPAAHKAAAWAWRADVILVWQGQIAGLNHYNVLDELQSSTASS